MSKRTFVLVLFAAATINAVAQLREGSPTLSPQTQRRLDAAQRAYVLKARTELIKAIPIMTALRPLAPNADQRRIDSLRNSLRIQMAALSDALGYYNYAPSDFSILGRKVQDLGDALGMDCGRVVTMEDEANVEQYLRLVQATMTPDLSLNKASTPSDPYGLSSPFASQFRSISDSVKEARTAFPANSVQQPAIKAAAAKNLPSVNELLMLLSTFSTVEGPRLSQPDDQPKLNARVCRLTTNLKGVLQSDPKANDATVQPKLLKLQESLVQLREQSLQGREAFLPCRTESCDR